MKKIIFLAAVFVISGAAALQKKVPGLVIKEKTTTKTVVFSIFLASNYSNKLYSKSRADVTLTAYKIKGNTPVILWESIIDKGNLRNYPAERKPLFRRLDFYNIRERKEDIVVSYKVRYNSRGSEFSYEQSCLLNSRSGDTVYIGL